MPVDFVTAEEFAKLTGGYRGSVYIGAAPFEATQAEKVTGGVSVSALLRVVEKPEIRRSTLRSL